MGIDIIDIWFGIANRQISSIFTELFAHDMSVFSFLDDKFSKYQWIFKKLGVCIDIVEIWFKLMGKFCQFFTGLSAHVTSIFSFMADNFRNISRFQETWCVHRNCGDLVWVCLWANFLNCLQHISIFVSGQ